jgi:hypothetical protein
MPDPNLGQEIDTFVNSIDSLTLTSAISSKALELALESVTEELKRILDKAVQLVRASEERQQDALHMVVSSHDLFLRLQRAAVATEVVPKSFLVALVSQLDAYLGSLLKSIFMLRPELLESSERSLTFAELTKFGTLEKARDYVLEKEIETFLRKSHAEQFSWLEKKFGLNLRTNLEVWPAFIEVTERRNLYVHTGGVVSSQYIDVCSLHGVDVASVQAGEKLTVTSDYLEAAHDVIYEIGVKLGEVLWRKLAPDQTPKAEELLQNLTYSLLVEKRYSLARVLLEFAVTTLDKRHTDEKARLTFLINRALVSYLTANKNECLQILDSQDWSATNDIFKLANLVLREKFEDAAKLMREIGPKNRPKKAEYLNWPLFNEFRNTPHFSSAFKDLFGELTENDLNLSQVDEKTPEENGERDISRSNTAGTLGRDGVRPHCLLYR